MSCETGTSEMKGTGRTDSKPVYFTSNVPVLCTPLDSSERALLRQGGPSGLITDWAACRQQKRRKSSPGKWKPFAPLYPPAYPARTVTEHSPRLAPLSPLPVLLVEPPPPLALPQHSLLPSLVAFMMRGTCGLLMLHVTPYRLRLLCMSCRGP